MRTLLTLLLLMIGLIVGAFLSQHYLAETGAELSDLLEATTAAVTDGRWSEANRLAEELQSLWERTKNGWGFFTEHEEIDDINGTLARLTGYVAEKDAPSCRAEAEAALRLFRHVPEKEILNLANLF